jgi:hypothetical protein
VALFTYTGEVPRTYPTYLDVTDPAKPVKTLDAEPGGSYEIRPADGHTVPGAPGEDGVSEPEPLQMPVPPADGFWKPAKKARGGED